MNIIDIFEIGMAVFVVIIMIDYSLCKLRKYGQNPHKLLGIFKKGK